MAAASATAAVTGALLPHTLLSHRSPPPQVLSVASSFRRLSLYASPRRTTHIVARADASAEAGEPEPSAEPESEAQEGEAEGAVPVAEQEEEAADEPASPPSKPAVKFGEIIGVIDNVCAIHYNSECSVVTCLIASISAARELWYSPRIKEIKVIRHKKVRRAKLYYLKHKLPRFSTFK
ncbi:hypothetical protein PR202_gb09228 [Eleusine coracana subsp. coracana]|uniref:Uncharacterized protein n=1 Tax=Eleusine coracana subsp. coracana TaxID=191504 RepID=A0AAV5EHR4_ELECO|nr:hypothetical protein PR202_gb09228 [Eleusine coracana subsp. coracana]